MTQRIAIRRPEGRALCDFIERYKMACRGTWSKSLAFSQASSLRYFDEWLKLSKIPLSELTWQRMMEFDRFLAFQGLSPDARKYMVARGKQALRWGIEQGELPQKIEDIYTVFHGTNQWTHDLPKLSSVFLEQLQVTHPKSHQMHIYGLRIFHTYLESRGLTYRRLRREHLAAYLKYLQERGLQQRTRCAVCRVVRSYLRWLQEERKLGRTADELFPSRMLPRYGQGLPRPIDPDMDARLQQILRETDDVVYKGILLIRRTGMRVSEIQKLDFDCIQYDARGRAALKVPAVKLGLEHRVPLDPETIELVHKIQEMSTAYFKKAVQPKRLVIGPNGRPPDYYAYWNGLTEILTRLRPQKWFNLHALRHTYATSLLNAGMSITSLKEILGHKTIAMTLVYAKVTQEKIHDEYAKALASIGDDGIPRLLAPQPPGLDAAFSEIGSHIAKSLDRTADPQERRQLRALQNRLSKIKSALPKASGGDAG